MHVIIFGLPGSGKGTQSSLLEKNKNFFKISPGDLLRLEIKKNEKLSFSIREQMKNGRLINDQIIFDLILKNLLGKDCILFDGYPRTLYQAEFLSKNNIYIDLIININIEANFVLKRIKYRMIDKRARTVNLLCSNVNKIRYKENFSGFNFFKRLDDRKDIIIKRVFEYEKQIKFLIEFYLKNKASILNLDGNQDINSVYMIIEKFIDKIKKKNE